MLGMGKGLGGDIARTTDLRQMNILYHIISLVAIKSGA